MNPRRGRPPKNIDVARAIQLYVEERLPFTAIGEMMGASGVLIKNRLHAAGIASRPRRRLDPNIEDYRAAIEAEFVRTRSISEVANNLGLRWSMVRAALIESGQVVPKAERQRRVSVGGRKLPKMEQAQFRLYRKMRRLGVSREDALIEARKERTK